VPTRPEWLAQLSPLSDHRSLCPCVPSSTQTDEEQAALRNKVCAGTWDVQPQCSDAALGLVTRILQVDPQTRATLDEVCAHPWVAGEDNEEVPWQGLPDLERPISRGGAV